jgi:hypothetical protein
MTLTFMPYYPENSDFLRRAQFFVGSLGTIFFVSGYTVYGLMKCFILDSLEKNAYVNRSSPFTTFRLVYFGNKSLSDL